MSVILGAWSFPSGRGWTVPRAQALRVLSVAGRARRSNTTCDRLAGGEAGVYWQTTAWLELEGLAASDGDYVKLTDLGRALVRDLERAS